MENSITTNADFFPTVLKDVHNGERIYFTAGDNEEYVLISRKELEQMEKTIAFDKLIEELDKIREDNHNKNTWVSEEDADKILGWD